MPIEYIFTTFSKPIPFSLTPQVINKTTDTSFHLIIFVEILMCSQQPDVYKRQEYILDADVWEEEPGTYPAFNYQQMPLMGNCQADRCV